MLSKTGIVLRNRLFGRKCAHGSHVLGEGTSPWCISTDGAPTFHGRRACFPALCKNNPNLATTTLMASIAQSAIANLKVAGLAEILYVPGQQDYKTREESFWSLTPRLEPWAIVQPRNTEEVSKAVKALVNTTDCKFAVRRLVYIGTWTVISCVIPISYP